jgi:rhodanese-related sulfurtransferase
MKTITVQELKNRIDSGEQINLIDVREPNEYAQANINAQLIPLGQISSGMIEELEELRDKEVIIHCRSGMRSMQACMILEQLGFTNTVNVTGGILAWIDAYGN